MPASRYRQSPFAAGLNSPASSGWDRSGRPAQLPATQRPAERRPTQRRTTGIIEIDGSLHYRSATIVRRAVAYAALTSQHVRICNARAPCRHAGLRPPPAGDRDGLRPREETGHFTTGFLPAPGQWMMPGVRPADGGAWRVCR